MLLTYRISRIGERGLPLGTPQPATTCSKLTIETLEQKCEICSKLTIKPPKRRNGYNGIIRDIKFKFTFKTVFIESKDVNIILFQNERYFTSLFLQLHIFIGANFSGEELKEVLYETIFFKRWRFSRTVSQFEPLYIPVDRWCSNLLYCFP